MTTYQDQPPLSRRAIRNGERAESSPQEPLFPGPGEPLVYATQNRPPLPGYETPAHGRRAAEPREETQPPADPGAQEQPQQRFRRRDYSPEGRSPLAPWSTAPAPDAEGGVVEYHTQGRPTPDADAPAAPEPSPLETPASLWAPAAPPAPAAEPASATPAASAAADAARPAAPSAEQTMTRRELRALRERHRIQAVDTDGTPVVPESAPLDEAQVDEAPVAEAPVAPTEAPSASPLVEPTDSYRSALAEFDALTTGSSMPAAQPAPEPAVAAQPEPRVEAQPEPEPLVEPSVQVAAPPSDPFAPAPAESAPAQPAPVQPAPQYLPPQPSALSTGERPVGHWTNQADLDDAIHGSLATGSRGVGTGGAITTSALVLPSLPGQDLITGEVMVTGSINLPEALSSTGAHPSQLDQSHLDHLLDAEDEQVVNTDSIPIRAIRAVSSHTSTRGVIAAQKPRGTKALTALIISASAMAVVVVTLLVVAIATNVFGS